MTSDLEFKNFNTLLNLFTLIKKGMKRRHAALRAGAQPMKARRRTGLTDAGRKKLSEMMKARWAAKRKAGVK